jgi:flagellin-like protein
MGKMKANRKFKEADDHAVSAVIGVILMVAITVAIAATVYVYVSGMIGGTQKQTPNVSMVSDNSGNLLRVASADVDIAWADIEITATNTTGATVTGTTSYAGSYVTAGDTISYDTWLDAHSGDRVTITFRYVPTNSLIGTWNVI